MNTIKTIEVAIQGTTPLLINKFTDEAQQKATSGSAMAINGDRGSPLEQASRKLYIGTKNKPIIPQPNLFRSVIDAGKFFKNGKSKVTTQKSSLIPACLEIHGIEILINHKEPWTVDTRPVRIPSTGGRILAHRPCFFDWLLNFDMSVDTEFVAIKLIREIIDAAGKRIGLGDFRPDCKGPYGKFVVKNWNELKD